MINKIIEIVRSASELMLTDTFEINQKAGFANIVTSSDLAVQSYLIEQLGKLIPGCGFICEEEGVNDATREYTWIIDPIDGTANYARGIRECAISVGLRHNDVMEAGVVFLPRTGEMFTAEHGKGAYLNGRQIHTSDRPFGNAILCTALAVYHKEYTQTCANIIADTFLECNDIRRFGAAAAELCYVAMGRCELYFEYLLSAWDYAAASLILEEAGGCLCNLKGEPLNPTLPSGVLGANCRESLNKFLEIVKRHV